MGHETAKSKEFDPAYDRNGSVRIYKKENGELIQFCVLDLPKARVSQMPVSETKCTAWRVLRYCLL